MSEVLLHGSETLRWLQHDRARVSERMRMVLGSVARFEAHE
jgi:hypothetical protein